jgi:lipoprotein-releasing system ATP-binding protein
MLEVSAVTKSYSAASGTVPVLEHVDFRLVSGEAAAITGPSGSGKSTLLYLLGGLEPPTTGRLTLNGEDPYALSPDGIADFRNRHIGFVFQDHCLLPQLTVLENVLVPTLVGGARTNERGEDLVRYARQLVDQVGLTSRIDHRPAALSGGERQRVAVARALVRRPTLVLADEPTGNLDAGSAAAVTALLLDLHRRQGGVLVVVTHSPSVAGALPIRFELARGRLARVEP